MGCVIFAPYEDDSTYKQPILLHAELVSMHNTIEHQVNPNDPHFYEHLLLLLFEPHHTNFLGTFWAWFAF